MDKTVELVRETERYLSEVNPALMLSLAVGDALEKDVDAFSLGYKYNFTAIAECGFATAVDSFLAVKEFVYDKKVVSLAELGRILAADWEGYDELRLRMKNSSLNLQVRVAGWNVRWNDIPRKEQDEYIARIETVMKGF